MIRQFLFTSLLACIVIATHAQDNKTEYYGIPQPITFNEKQYFLSDAYHPKPLYYKQEYIQTSENADKFTTMVIIDALITDLPPREVASAKATELENLKKSNPVVQYNLLNNANTGEYMLDFLISASEGGKVSVVEWNAYRYVSFKTTSGKNGVMLFAFARRAYGDDVMTFLTHLKTERFEYINKVGSYPLPAIRIKD